MSGFFEKDYLDLYDVRKAKKAGKVKKSLHAETNAELRGIDIDDYLDCLNKFPPAYDKSFVDDKYGLPGYKATVETTSGINVTGYFVQNEDPSKSDEIVLKTVHEFNKEWLGAVEDRRKQINEPNGNEKSVVKVVTRKNDSGCCSDCIQAKKIMGKTVCEFHRINKIAEEGIISISLAISKPEATSCDGFKSR